MLTLFVVSLLISCLIVGSEISEPIKTHFDNLDFPMRSLIFKNLSPLDLYHMHRSLPSLKAHVEEYSAGFKIHEDLLKKCRKWWHFSTSSNVLDKLYGADKPQANDPYETGGYGTFSLNSISDACLDMINQFCSVHRNSDSNIEIAPLNVVVSYSSQLSRLHRLYGCQVHLIIEFGELLHSQKFLHSLIQAIMSPGNRISALTVHNQKSCFEDWAICREVMFNIVPGLHYVVSHFSNEHCKVKSLTLLELDNLPNESETLLDTISVALTETEMEHLKLDKIDVSGYDLSALITGSINFGSLKRLSLSSVTGMDYNDEFWRAALSKLTSLEISNQRRFMWSDMVSLSDQIMALTHTSSIEQMKLANLECLHECMSVIVDIVRSPDLGNLRTLDLSELSLDDASLYDIFDKLCEGTQLESISLKGSVIASKKTFERLINALTDSKYLKVNVDISIPGVDIIDYFQTMTRQFQILTNADRRIRLGDYPLPLSSSFPRAWKPKFYQKPMELQCF